MVKLIRIYQKEIILFLCQIIVFIFNSEFENYDFPFKKRHIIITTSTFLGGENNIIMFYSLILSLFMMLTNFLFFKRSETFKISNKSLLNL